MISQVAENRRAIALTGHNLAIGHGGRARSGSVRGEAVPGAAGRGGFGAFWAVAAVVAPAARGARAGREHLVVAVGGQAVAHPLVGGRALLGDIFRAAEVPGQRVIGVRPGEDLAGGQVVEFHPVARPPQPAPGRASRRSMRPETAILSVRVATVLSTPSGSSAGSSPAT